MRQSHSSQLSNPPSHRRPDMEPARDNPSSWRKHLITHAMSIDMELIRSKRGRIQTRRNDWLAHIKAPPHQLHRIRRPRIPKFLRQQRTGRHIRCCIFHAASAYSADCQSPEHSERPSRFHRSYIQRPFRHSSPHTGMRSSACDCVYQHHAARIRYIQCHFYRKHVRSRLHIAVTSCRNRFATEPASMVEAAVRQYLFPFTQAAAVSFPVTYNTALLAGLAN